MACKVDKKFLSLVACCFVMWSTIGGLYIYDRMTHEPKAMVNQTYRPAPPISSNKVKAGVYTLDVIQPVTVFGRIEYLIVNYRIEKTVNGDHWVASRKIKVNGATFDVGADVFRTKSDAIEYISKTGRYMDYGVGKQIGIGGIR